MPELPEVETTCRALAPHLLNKKITAVIVRQPKLRWPIPTQIMQQQLTHKPILEVSRRAKYILVRVKKGTLIIHLGMSGSLKIVDKNEPLSKHDHVDLILSSGKILRFNDPRRFGALLFSHQLEDVVQLSHLGLEPFSAEFTSHYLHQQAHMRRCSIKTLIMNHKILVGVGNIYANESLFAAGIHPLYPAKKLSLEKLDKLCHAIQRILTAAIQKGGTTLKDYYQTDGKPGQFKSKLKIYDRKGLPCYRCRTLVQLTRHGQRSTYFCPQCQKSPSFVKKLK